MGASTLVCTSLGTWMVQLGQPPKGWRGEGLENFEEDTPKHGGP